MKNASARASLFNLFPKAAVCAALLASGALAQTVSLQGTVLSVSGEPVANAVVQFKKISNQAVTNAQGFYSFTGSAAVRKAEGYSIDLEARNGRLELNLERSGKVAVDLYSLDGKWIQNLMAGEAAAGRHALAMPAAGSSHQLYLLKVRIGSETAWHKLTWQAGVASVTAGSAVSIGVLAKDAATSIDSMFCTSPTFHGGLAKINGRSISSYAGTQNFRMFSSDPAWKAQCSMPMTFNFDASPGAARYKELIPDWVATEQEVLTEVCQSTFKKATEPKKYSSYIANIKTGAGGQVAATGGNTLGFSTEYIANQPNSYAGWWELVGVQTHEAVHSYQAYYDTQGAAGFGESMPDAVRALNGFFSWPRGTRCTGAYTDAYQGGGQYWYFIEMKHPGFLTGIWQTNTGDISARVQTLTGESLTSLVNECKTVGMP